MNNDTKFKVAEKFVSINGEARLAGELAVFIRFTGCNLCCSYCDTAWAIPQDAPHEIMTLSELVEYADDSGIKNVTLTGGEPLLQEGLTDLILELIAHNHKVEIETNGALSIEKYAKLAEKMGITDELSITMDYKCPSSGVEAAMLPENYIFLRSYDTVKFVVGDREDLDKARAVIAEHELIERKIKVYLSAVFGKITPAEIVEYMKENKMIGVTYQLQQHKYIWDPDKRGV